MNRRVVGAVLRRELTDVLRDRRTLFASFVLPIILYPALTVGFGALAAREKAALAVREAKIVVRTTPGAESRRVDGAAASGALVSLLRARPQFVFVDEADGPAAVRAGRAALAIEIPADLEARLARREEVALRPAYRSHDPASAAAFDAFQECVRELRYRFAPLAVQAEDLSASQEKGGARFGGIVAFVVVLMALIGTFGPAVDLAAGEKERGTLEALLTTPARRRDLVFGKYLAVLVCGAAAAFANLGSLAASLGALPLPGGAGGVSFSAGGFLWVLTALVLLTAVFGAVALALSAAARTYKEGAAYLAPLYVVVMPLAMSAMLPTAEFADGWWIPVADVALLVKAAATGVVPIGPAVGTVALLLVLAAAALKIATTAFEREEILFRASGETTAASTPGRTGGPPTVGEALLAPAAAVGLSFALGARAAANFGPASAFVLQFGLLALVPIVLARVARRPLVAACALVRPGPTGVVGALLAGLGATFLALETARWTGGAGAATAEETSRALGPWLARGPWFAFLCFAVVPALVEELHFRGFVWAGFRSGLGRAGGTVAAAAAFAAAHLSPDRFPQLFVLGLVFGLLRETTGSVVPAMLAHLVNNGIVVAAATATPGSTIAGWTETVAAPASVGERVAIASAAAVVLALGIAAARKGRGALLGGGGEGG